MASSYPRRYAGVGLQRTRADAVESSLRRAPYPIHLHARTETSLRSHGTCRRMQNPNTRGHFRSATGRDPHGSEFHVEQPQFRRGEPELVNQNFVFRSPYVSENRVSFPPAGSPALRSSESLRTSLC